MTNRSPFASRRTWLLGSLLVITTLAPRAAAGDAIQWRADYNAARKEAAEKGWPLFIDFGTEDCFHCKRLDASTFRDPTIVSLVNQRFVALRVDGNAEPNMVQALRIQAYPTMVIAAADGKILSVIEGYMEAGRLSEHLNRALNASTPDGLARDFQEATKSIGAGDYARALSLLRGIVEDGKDRPVQVKARQVLQEIEQQATGRLARAKQMHDQGQTLEATDVLADLLKRYPGTQAAGDGTRLLTSLGDDPSIRDGLRSRRARELLALAMEDFKAERFLSCLDHCELLTGTYRDLPEGKEGQGLATQIKGNPERMDKVCEAMNDRLASMYVVQAEAWAAKGDTAQAKSCFERAVKASPASAVAQGANVRLAQLEGKTTAQTGAQEEMK